MKRSSTPIFPLLMILAGVLLVLVTGFWYLSGGELFTTRTPSETVVITEDTYADIPRTSVEDAKAALDSGAAVFVDVRDAQSYSQRHVKGALSIPLGELPDRIGELKPSDWIITYCT